MTGLRERVEDPSRTAEWIDLAGRLERGEPAGPADPLDTLAAIVFAAMDDGGPPLLRSRPNRPGLIPFATEPALAPLFPRLGRSSRLAISAGLLQMLDAWEPSHEAAQEADDLGESSSSAFWHAIAHRREPDPGNAAYWFRRVGRHPVLAALTETAGPILDGFGDESLAQRLVKGGAWDPIAFVGFCGEAARRPGSAEEALARAIQRAEMMLLLSSG